MSEPLDWNGRISLAQVLEHTIPAYGGTTWDEVFAYLHSTDSEAKVIAELAASTALNGEALFDEPICVFPLDFDDDEDPDDVDPMGRTWRVGNGMHRIATAALLNHTHINATTTYPDEDPDTHFVEVVYELPNHAPVVKSPYPSADALDFSCGWLRSFPLPDGTWVECDSFSGSHTQVEGLWRCPETHMDVFLAELQARAPGLIIYRATGKTAAELDAEYDAAGV